MSRSILTLVLAGLIILPIAVSGCKGKVENPAEEPRMEVPEAVSSTTAVSPLIEPSQTVAMVEAVPPTAAAQQIKASVSPLVQSAIDRSKDIQRALKNAGFDPGTIDGKLGPKTKQAILDFQKAKNLKADGKVGPKTWSELEKYLIQQ
jgi:peptidoglycan hydrolase-like protein with peptidoglycan-binding domain